MKKLNGLELSERQRRHRLIIEKFERHEAENLPWMARTSMNDPDVIIEITDSIREPVGVYTWFAKGDWISISASKIARCIDGKYDFIEFGKNNIQIIESEDCLLINGIVFKSPPELVSIYASLAREVENMANAAS